MRLTPEEHELFQRKASGYHNVSAMIRDAVRQFNDGSKDGNREHEVGGHGNYDDIDDERKLKR